MDHERFLEEILVPVKEQREVYLRRFCHETFEPGEAEKIDVKPIIIAEGSYSCNERLKSFYDMTIFVTVNSETQLNRIRLRNPDKYDLFVEKWIPLEEMYFEAFSVEKNCDLIYSTDIIL